MPEPENCPDCGAEVVKMDGNWEVRTECGRLCWQWPRDAGPWHWSAAISRRCEERQLAAAKARIGELRAAGRIFPIQGGPTVPWSVMAPHEAQAHRNHFQSLASLAERGGLDSAEAWAVVNDTTWRDATGKWTLEEMGKLWREFAEKANAAKAHGEQGWAEAERLAKAMPAAGHLRLLAAGMTTDPEAQRDLRAWADAIDKALAAYAATKKVTP